MKKAILLLVILGLIIFPAGCAKDSVNEQPSARFYYLRTPTDYVYGASDGVVTWEARDISGNESATRYLLSLYLQGPLDESLRSPFPADCKVIGLTQNHSEITIILNGKFTALKGMDLTLGCICLARTCMSITGAETVHIQAEGADGQISTIQTITAATILPDDSLHNMENET